MERRTTCCFTGHRPDKLPWGRDEGHPDCLALKEELHRAVERAYELGYRHFISGMARGSDLYFARAVLALREEHPDVTLEGARPCESQADSWPAGERAEYAAILDACKDAGVKGIINFGMGLTLREGSREYFYAQLDRHFPGLKERYIHTYGNAYELPSPRHRELSRLFHSTCEQYGIWHDNDRIFRYLTEFEEKNQQLSFF